MAAIPDKFLDLFEKKSFATLTTLMPDGQPQATPVWIDYADGHLLVNSARGRQKDRNLQRDPRVAVLIPDPDNPYRYLQVRGRVVEITEQGADAHINKQAKHYLDKDVYPWRGPNEVRVLYKIKPEHVQGYGG